jgi:hypothetical protein
MKDKSEMNSGELYTINQGIHSSTRTSEAGLARIWATMLMGTVFVPAKWEVDKFPTALLLPVCITRAEVKVIQRGHQKIMPTLTWLWQGNIDKYLQRLT